MNEVKELKFDSTLWATPAKLVNLLDFKPEKLSIKTENDKLSTIITHQVRYENGGFYLTIDNIKGYFGFIDNRASNVVLNMIFSNDDQKNKYHQVWKEIFEIVDNGNGELKLHEKIVLSDSDIPTNEIIKIPSVTIVINSLLDKDNKFYLELSLNHCLYKDPLFTYRARLVNILDFNPKKLSIEKVCAIDDEQEHIYYIKYGGDPFYLVINDLKGYCKYSKEKNTKELTTEPSSSERISLEHKKELEFIIEDQKQAKIYNQIWNKIKELLNSVDGVNFGFSDYFRDHGIIIFDTDDTLPLENIVSIYSTTIIIRSVYRDYYDRFYPQIHLENFIYRKC